MARGLYTTPAESVRAVEGLRSGFAPERWRANPGTPKTVWITPAAVAPSVVGPYSAKSDGATKASEYVPRSVSSSPAGRQRTPYFGTREAPASL